MLMGALRGKVYPWSKYANVAVIVTGVALFMGGGSQVQGCSDERGCKEEIKRKGRWGV